MDVCPVRAIGMHVDRAQSALEGSCRTHDLLGKAGRLRAETKRLAAYPYLATPARCDGCGLCIRECPVSALTWMDVPLETNCKGPTYQSE